MGKFKIPPDEYLAFLKGIELTGVYLKKVDTELVKDKIDISRPVDVEPKGRANYENVEPNVIRVKQQYNIKMSDRENGELLVYVKCAYILTYESGTPMTDDIWEVFKARSVQMVIWPYIREIFDSTLRRFGLPPLFLPARII